MSAHETAGNNASWSLTNGVCYPDLAKFNKTCARTKKLAQPFLSRPNGREFWPDCPPQPTPKLSFIGPSLKPLRFSAPKDNLEPQMVMKSTATISSCI